MKLSKEKFLLKLDKMFKNFLPRVSIDNKISSLEISSLTLRQVIDLPRDTFTMYERYTNNISILTIIPIPYYRINIYCDDKMKYSFTYKKDNILNKMIYHFIIDDKKCNCTCDFIFIKVKVE